MRYFTYNEYVDCTNNEEWRKMMRVEELNSPYTRINNRHTEEDKKIIEILKDKIQMTRFINEFLKIPERIKLEDLHINKELKQKDDKITLYKIRNKEMYILIKIINAPNQNLCYDIFEESMKIIQKWDEREDKKDLNYPIVIPIVIYTGEKEWRETNNDFRYTSYSDRALYLSYNFINKKDFYKFIN